MVVGMAGSTGRAPGECQALGKQLSSGGLRVCAGRVEGGQCPTVGLRGQGPGSHTAPLSRAWSEQPCTRGSSGGREATGLFPCHSARRPGPTVGGGRRGQEIKCEEWAEGEWPRPCSGWGCEWRLRAQEARSSGPWELGVGRRLRIHGHPAGGKDEAGNGPWFHYQDLLEMYWPAAHGVVLVSEIL